MQLLRASFLALAAVALSVPPSAQVECANVLPGFGTPGVDGEVGCFGVFDDGTGPALYLGGRFASAGTAAAANIARFDGVRWSALGAGLGPPESAGAGSMVVFDFGAGRRLVVCGFFTSAGGIASPGIAAWDGSSWSAIGNGLAGYGEAVVVFDDGSGPKLHASAAGRVVRWSGTAWDPVGVDLGTANRDLAVHDDGSGPRLHVSGIFGATNNPGVARWNGINWQLLAPVFPSSAGPLVSHDDGSGAKLYAAGSSSVSSVVRRNGSVWENVGTIAGALNALEVLDLLDGNGPRLYAVVEGASSGPRIACWDGSTWNDVGSGTLVSPRSIAVFDTGAGRKLFAGSTVYGPAELASGVAHLEGAQWIAAHPGRGLVNDFLSNALSTPLQALAQHDAGSGPEVYAGGHSLLGLPGVLGGPIARWTGSGWADTGMPYSYSVTALESFDLGGGREFFAGVENYGVLRRSGATWVPLSSAPLFDVHDIQGFDVGAGPLVAAGGTAIQFGGIPRALVRTWNGSGWTTIGEGTPESRALAFAFFDDGSGPALYCAGRFGALNGTLGTQGIARWNGTSWSSVGGGLDVNESIEALVVHDDGTGPALYAGGRFSGIGGAPIADIARWNGSTWSMVGVTGTGGSTRGVMALVSHDSGGGAALWAGGDFTSIGGIGANRLARWNGAAWSAFGTGADGVVTELASFDEGTGSERILWAVGGFESIDGVGSESIARIGCAIEPGYAFCFGDAAHGPTPCPCGNAGATGHGCASPAASVGAILEASGTTTPATPGGVDSVTLVCSGLPQATTTLFFQGSQRIAPAPFGDGVLCVGGATVRLAIEHASSGVARYPGPGDAPLSVRGQSPFGSGITRYYQVWYRTSASACSSATWNISSGREITW